jgi:integrase
METKTRNKGTGSVRARGNGRWQVVFTTRPGSGQKRVQGYETVHGTKKDAEARLRTILEELDHGTHIKRTKETVGEFLRRWQVTYAEANTSERTQYGYERVIVTQLLPTLGEIPLTDVRPDDVLAMHKRLFDRGLSARTVLHAHRLLSQALNHAVKWQALAINPCTAVDAPRPRIKEMQTLDWTTAKVFFAAIEGHRFEDLYLVDFYLGLRRSELLALRWADVNLDDSTLRVVAGLHRIKGKGLLLLDTKTQSSRRNVALQHEVVERLRAIKVRQMEHCLSIGVPFSPHRFVFSLADGRPLSPEATSREFHRLMVAAGLHGIRLHDLRHSMSSLMLADGVPIKYVQERLGHSSPMTTLSVYAHALPGEHARYAEQLADRLHGT